MEAMLEEDSKNYHVWDYKLWLTLHFSKEKDELDSTEVKIFKGDEVKKMVEEQLKDSSMKVHTINWANCYSLWSYRHNLISKVVTGITEPERSVVWSEELGRVMSWLGE